MPLCVDDRCFLNCADLETTYSNREAALHSALTNCHKWKRDFLHSNLAGFFWLSHEWLELKSSAVEHLMRREKANVFYVLEYSAIKQKRDTFFLPKVPIVKLWTPISPHVGNMNFFTYPSTIAKMGTFISAHNQLDLRWSIFSIRPTQGWPT